MDDAAGVTATETTETTETTTAESWRDTLPDDLRGNTDLQQFADVPALAKSYVEVRSKVGEGRFTVPGVDASPEQLDAFHKAIGRPDTAQEYAVPEGLETDEAALKAFWPEAHKAGLTKQQAAHMVRLAVERDLGEAKTVAENREKEHTEAVVELKKEWGEAFEEQAALAKTTANVMGLQDHLVKLGLDNDPVFAKAFAKYGKILEEDQVRGKGPGTFSTTAQEAETECLKIEASPEYNDRKHAGHKPAMERYKRLMSVAHPGDIAITAPGSVEVGTGTG